MWRVGGGKSETNVWTIRSDEELTLGSPALESLYGAQITSSFLLTKPNSRYNVCGYARAKTSESVAWFPYDPRDFHFVSDSDHSDRIETRRKSYPTFYPYSNLFKNGFVFLVVS